MKPSQRYANEAGVMSQFRDAYLQLLNNAQLTQGEFLYIPILGPRRGVDQRTWTALMSDVASAAGAAATAYTKYGGRFALRNAAYAMDGVDPVANWQMSLNDPKQLPPEYVVTSVESAIARATQESKDAAERERGLTGLIAGFLRWPTNLREAVGPGRGQRTAAGVIGVFGQVIVGAVAAALASGIVAGAVALWAVVF